MTIFLDVEGFSTIFAAAATVAWAEGRATIFGDLQGGNMVAPPDERLDAVSVYMLRQGRAGDGRSEAHGLQQAAAAGGAIEACSESHLGSIACDLNTLLS
jgi:hypothetical protein